MRIGIDVQRLFGPPTGVRRYLATMLDGLLTEHEDTDFRLFRFRFPGPAPLPASEAWRGYDQRSALFPEKVYAKLLQFNLAFPVDFDCDVYFFPNFIGYPIRRGRSCIVVYDLAHLHFPQFVEPKNLRYLRRALPASIRRADRIVAISASTAADIERFFGAGDRTSVVPVPLSPVFRPIPPNESDAVLNRLGVDTPYILAVGTIEPRKNFDGLIRAFSALSPELSRTHRLVFAGGRGWLEQSFQEAMSVSPVRQQITTLGAVDDPDLVALYNQASVVVSPSFYEGFGLPVIEAMACGTPVIATNVSSLPEAGGDAAILVPPNDQLALVEAMERVLAGGIARAEVVAKGSRHAARYNAPGVTRELLTVLGSLAEST